MLHSSASRNVDFIDGLAAETSAICPSLGCEELVGLMKATLFAVRFPCHASIATKEYACGTIAATRGGASAVAMREQTHGLVARLTILCIAVTIAASVAACFILTALWPDHFVSLGKRCPSGCRMPRIPYCVESGSVQP